LSTTDLLNTVTRDVLNADEDTSVSQFCFADAEVTCDVCGIVHWCHSVSRRSAEGVVAVVDSRAVVAGAGVCLTRRVKPCNEWISDIAGTVQRHFRASRDRCVLWCTNQRRFHYGVYKCTHANGPRSMIIYIYICVLLRNDLNLWLFFKPEVNKLQRVFQKKIWKNEDNGQKTTPADRQLNKKLSYRWQTVRCWFVKLLKYGRTFVRIRRQEVHVHMLQTVN